MLTPSCVRRCIQNQKHKPSGVFIGLVLKNEFLNIFREKNDSSRKKIGSYLRTNEYFRFKQAIKVAKSHLNPNQSKLNKNCIRLDATTASV